MDSLNLLSPTPRHGKFGWYNQFLKLNNSKSKILMIGDSLNSNLLRYFEIWRKYFIYHGTQNFGIAGYKFQNVLWRVGNLNFP